MQDRRWNWKKCFCQYRCVLSHSSLKGNDFEWGDGVTDEQKRPRTALFIEITLKWQKENVFLQNLSGHKARRAPVQTADVTLTKTSSGVWNHLYLTIWGAQKSSHCPRLDGKLSFSFAFDLKNEQKTNQLIKAITSMYIMNKREETSSSFHRNHRN